MSNSDTKKCTVEPIRGSVAILGIKFVLVFLILDGFYGLLYYVITLGVSLPFDLHHHIAVILFATFLVKVALQIYFVLYAFLIWANNIYYITDEELVKRQGIFSIHEQTYKFDTIRSIAINRSFLGKLFGFGDMIITAVTGGNRQESILLSGVSNPNKYRTMLRDCCKKLVKEEVLFEKR